MKIRCFKPVIMLLFVMLLLGCNQNQIDSSYDTNADYAVVTLKGQNDDFYVQIGYNICCRTTTISSETMGIEEYINIHPKSDILWNNQSLIDVLFEIGELDRENRYVSIHPSTSDDGTISYRQVLSNYVFDASYPMVEEKIRGYIPPGSKANAFIVWTDLDGHEHRSSINLEYTNNHNREWVGDN